MRLRTRDLDWRFRVIEENDSTRFRAEAGACPALRQERNWTMPQLQLPVFPQGMTSITEDLAFPLHRATIGKAMAAQLRPTPTRPLEIIDLLRLTVSDLDPLLEKEIETWRQRLDW